MTIMAERSALDGLLSSFISNPSMLGTLASLVSSKNNQMGDLSARINSVIDEVSAEPKHELVADNASVESRPTHEPTANNGVIQKKRREALLMALKPYLSPTRAEAIDKLLVISEIGELFSGDRG